MIETLLPTPDSANVENNRFFKILITKYLKIKSTNVTNGPRGTAVQQLAEVARNIGPEIVKMSLVIAQQKLNQKTVT